MAQVSHGATAQDDVVRKILIIRLQPGKEKFDHNREMQSSKRTVQVNVKMSEEDFQLLQRAAAALWPAAILSNSGIILGLAKISAKEIIQRTSTKRHK